MAYKHYLPSKLLSYLKRLELEYQRTGDAVLREIITSSRVMAIEETAYDNWNGGTYGHDVKFFLPAEIMSRVGIDEQRNICAILLDDLSKCAISVDNESFRAVHIELADETDTEYQQAQSLAEQPRTNPEALPFWTPGELRLFISHRDIHKRAARDLADELKEYGISAFVAHDTIEPMTTWQREIEKGLETMEVMLAFVTDDFHGSVWTNQEVGYALGKGVPVIPVKFEQKDPEGFIGGKQALKGYHLERAQETAPAVYKLLVEKLGQKRRLQQALVSAFTSSPDWDAARKRFGRLQKAVTTLGDDEVRQIQAAYSSNEFLHGAWYLDNQYKRLILFMNRCTGKQFEIVGKELRTKEKTAKINKLDEEIPF